MALEGYQANEVARQGDQQAIEVMLGYRLGLEDLKSAELLWAELDAPSEAMTNSLQTLRDAEAERERENQLNAEARMNMDSSYGTRTRAFMGLLIATLFGGQAFISGYLTRSGHFVWRHAHNMAISLMFALFIWGFGRWARNSLRATSFNQRFHKSLLALSVLNVALCVLLWAAASNPIDVVKWQMGIFCTFSTTLGASLDRGILMGGAGYGLGLIGGVLFPAWMFEFIAFGHVWVGAWTAWQWRPAPDEAHQAPPR